MPDHLDRRPLVLVFCIQDMKQKAGKFPYPIPEAFDLEIPGVTRKHPGIMIFHYARLGRHPL
ncbi:MAG: hypothetical protein CSB33_02415 [Desulfobacterales bacterium]|nr:MAG: hypothetical protein CSB33_02415 [Desulfobacterales bacterium]